MGFVMIDTTLEREIAALPNLSRPALVARWQASHGNDPPKGISRSLLVRSIAYEMQAKRYGGLKKSTDRRLREVAKGSSGSNWPAPRVVPALHPEARLIREWNGVSHVVDVVEDGFVWNGDRHRSLSAVARAITGAHWSGPRFFGLDKP